MQQIEDSNQKTRNNPNNDSNMLSDGTLSINNKDNLLEKLQTNRKEFQSFLDMIGDLKDIEFKIVIEKKIKEKKDETKEKQDEPKIELVETKKKEDKKEIVLIVTTFNKLYAIYNKNIKKMSATKNLKQNWNRDDIVILRWCVMKYVEYKQYDSDKSLKDNDWKYISKMIPAKDTMSCRLKWLSMSKTYIKNEPWTEEEDRLLPLIIEQMNSEGNKGKKNWVKVSEQLFQQSEKYRAPKQCREHYNIKFEKKLIIGHWKPEEDLNLLELVYKYGQKWSLISKNWKERTENAIKNRYKTIFNKEITKLEKSVSQEENKEYSENSQSDLNNEETQEQENMEEEEEEEEEVDDEEEESVEEGEGEENAQNARNVEKNKKDERKIVKYLIQIKKDQIKNEEQNKLLDEIKKKNQVNSKNQTKQNKKEKSNLPISNSLDQISMIQSHSLNLELPQKSILSQFQDLQKSYQSEGLFDNDKTIMNQSMNCFSNGSSQFLDKLNKFHELNDNYQISKNSQSQSSINHLNKSGEMYFGPPSLFMEHQQLHSEQQEQQQQFFLSGKIDKLNEEVEQNKEQIINNINKQYESQKLICTSQQDFQTQFPNSETHQLVSEKQQQQFMHFRSNERIELENFDTIKQPSLLSNLYQKKIVFNPKDYKDLSESDHFKNGIMNFSKDQLNMYQNRSNNNNNHMSNYPNNSFNDNDNIYNSLMNSNFNNHNHNLSEQQTSLLESGYTNLKDILNNNNNNNNIIPQSSNSQEFLNANSNSSVQLFGGIISSSSNLQAPSQSFKQQIALLNSNDRTQSQPNQVFQNKQSLNNEYFSHQNKKSSFQSKKNVNNLSSIDILKNISQSKIGINEQNHIDYLNSIQKQQQQSIQQSQQQQIDTIGQFNNSFNFQLNSIKPEGNPIQAGNFNIPPKQQSFIPYDNLNTPKNSQYQQYQQQQQQPDSKLQQLQYEQQYSNQQF